MANETARTMSIDEAIDKSFSDAENKARENDNANAETVDTRGDTESQSEDNQSGQTEKAAEQTEDTADTLDILSKEEREKLFKDHPELKTAYQTLMKSYTPKTQELAEKRKEAEAVIGKYGKYSQLLESFESDPKETVLMLARNLGIDIADTKPTPQKEAIVDDQISKMTGQLTSLFGSDSAEFSQQLAQILKDNVVELSSKIADQKIDPIIKQQQESAKQKVMRDSMEAIKQFEKNHPDWKQFESKMTELSSKFIPAQGANVSDGEYLEFLYEQATKNKTTAQTTTEVVDKLKKMATNAEPQTQTVKDNIVNPTAPNLKDMSFDDAMDAAVAAAKRGERWS